MVQLVTSVTEIEASAENVAPLERTTPAPRRNWVLFGATVLGLVLLLYTSAADWFSTRTHEAELTGYSTALEEVTEAERTDEFERARIYNAGLPQGPLRDPFAVAEARSDHDGADESVYRSLLRVTPGEVMGRLTYPSLGIDLPVYHGTADAQLRRGVGHLYGSSLPVGGPGTHSVFTSHSGLAHAKLFTALPEAKVGEVFALEVLGRHLFYRVDLLQTVEPDEVGSLQLTAGDDNVTLITCTPIGINSHRLLVRGTRIEAPPTAQTEVPVGGTGLLAGFPWWALWFGLGATAAGAVFLRKPA